MEKISVKTASALNKYKESQKLIEATKQEVICKLSKAKDKSDLFQEKFSTIKMQIQSYRDLLKAIMDKASIVVCIEDARTEYNKGAARVVENSHREKNNLLFAIYASQGTFFNKTTSSFLAFCFDPEIHHIDVYEYTEPLVADSYKSLNERRNAFKKHAKHLTHDHIDKFNFEEIISYIEIYITKELETMVARSELPNPDYSDYYEYYYRRQM